ncbi:MAG: hypothetical protein ABI844_06985 [Saprospiraceae bacterium]
MKKFILILMWVCFAILTGNSQNIPQGMNYQAVARDLKGEVMANENLVLKINLFTTHDSLRSIYYSEIHTITTNELGLFSLIIGEGVIEKGQFDLIPWSSENIWMEVGLKDKKQAKFSTISNSKLLAVPYAMHAGTANQITGGQNNDQSPASILSKPASKPTTAEAPGVVSTTWSVFGNQKTNTSGNIYRLNSLGTTDFVDLFLITNNVERLRITADGDIKTKLNFEIGKSVLLNASSGSTVNNGPFTVDKMSPTLLTGTLTVLKSIKISDSLVVGSMKPTILTGTLRVDKSTKLNDSLTVTNMKPTLLTGTLTVDKSTKLNDSLTVTNMKPTLLTGTLTVDKSTKLNDSLTVTNMKPTLLTGTLTVDKKTKLNDTLTVTNMKPTLLTGTLTVDKSTKLNDSLTVTNMKPTLLTGTLTVDKKTKLNDTLTVTNTKPTILTGSLSVAGPLLSSNTLAVNGALNLGDSLNVLNMAPTALTGKLKVDKKTTLNDTLTVTGMKPTILTGTLNVQKPVDLDSSLNVDGKTTLNNTLVVSKDVPDGNYVAIFVNTNNGNGDGIKIRLGKDKASYTLPSSKDTLTTTQLDRIKSLLNCTTSTSDKGTALGDIVTEGLLQDLKYVGGLAVGIGNLLIDKINAGVGLPYNISTPINSGLSLPINISGPINSGIGLPFSISAPINSGLGLPYNFTAPINTGLGLPIGLSFLSVINSACDICVDDDDLPGGTTTIVPKIPDVSIPALPSIAIPAIPAFSIPSLPTLIIPKVPQIDLTSIGVTAIPLDDISFWGVPSLCLLDATSFPLNNENVFIRFTDKNDLKLGSVRAVSVADWATSFLNPIYLYGLYEAITSSVADKKHALYHFKYEAKKALKAYAEIGVEYSSGNGDYAEWLERSDLYESIKAGDIVGVKGGKITKDLQDAEQVMVVSHNPIVLGNIPKEGKVAYGNNIAFMGQVPVKVVGPVASGDYIIGNMNTPGYGLAKNQNDMTVEDYKYAVGRSWDNNPANGVKLINTVVGVHNGDFIKILKKFEDKFESTESRFQTLESKVDALLQKSSEKSNK